jgi:hypothetical protein
MSLTRVGAATNVCFRYGRIIDDARDEIGYAGP